MAHETKETTEAANADAKRPVQRRVMPKNSLNLMDDLAAKLGIAGDESTEVRWNDEVYKRRVLRAAIEQLDRAWNGA